MVWKVSSVLNEVLFVNAGMGTNNNNNIQYLYSAL